MNNPVPPPQGPSMKSLTAQMSTLRIQRNAALDTVAYYAGEIAEMEAETEALRKLVAQLNKQVEELTFHPPKEVE